MPVPQRNSLLSVVGEMIGIHMELGTLAILLHDITYLSTKNTGTTSSQTAVSNAPSGSHGTPSKRRGWDRWGGSGAMSTAPKTKRPALTPTSGTSQSTSSGTIQLPETDVSETFESNLSGSVDSSGSQGNYYFITYNNFPSLYLWIFLILADLYRK